MSCAIISRVTAAVDRRSSQNAAGRSITSSRFFANCRTDWQRGPSVPSIASGQPITKPPTPCFSTCRASAAASSRKRVRRIVSNGVAIVRRVSERAIPIVFVPTSRPIKRWSGARSRLRSAGLRIAMSDDSFRRLSGRAAWPRPAAAEAPAARDGGRLYIMALDKATVARIATLARIKVSESELDHLAGDLSHILTWVEKLGEVDTSNVEPMTSVAAMTLPVRDDVVTDGNRRDEVLANAP